MKLFDKLLDKIADMAATKAAEKVVAEMKQQRESAIGFKTVSAENLYEGTSWTPNEDKSK